MFLPYRTLGAEINDDAVWFLGITPENGERFFCPAYHYNTFFGAARIAHSFSRILAGDDAPLLLEMLWREPQLCLGGRGENCATYS
jgi:hypothetical protein